MQRRQHPAEEDGSAHVDEVLIVATAVRIEVLTHEEGEGDGGESELVAPGRGKKAGAVVAPQQAEDGHEDGDTDDKEAEVEGCNERLLQYEGQQVEEQAEYDKLPRLLVVLGRRVVDVEGLDVCATEAE